MLFRISKRAIGRALIWIGVLAWVPYILLTIGNVSPPILPFLSIHLLGILGGSWIKRSSPTGSEASAGWKKLGTLLTLVGIGVWIPYVALTEFTTLSPSLVPFLGIHLVAVVPGLAIRLGIEANGYRRRRSGSQDRQEIEAGS